MTTTIRLSIAFLMFFVSFTFADVKGQFKVDGATVIKPRHAAAYTVRDQMNPRAWQVEVVLAEGTVDTNAVIEAMDPHVDVINQEAVRSGNYILLWVNSVGRVSMNATLSETMSQFIDTTEQGDLKAELTTNATDRVAGRVFTVKPVKTLSGEVYELDVTFDTAVSRAPAGTKLPANGGEAGQAFHNLYQAVQKKDEKGIKAGVSPRVDKMLFADYNTPEENLKSAVEILTAWFPKKNMKITGGEMRGEAALLEVEGEIYEGRNALYIAKMEKGTSGWQLEEIVPAGMFPK
jgi:hypothetical protein